MKFFFIMLSICCYIISQTTIDARTTALRKMYWPLPPNGDYHGQKFDQRRQAGWGKRHDALIDDEYDDLPLYHPFVSQDNSARTWFDDT
jgi:hypothetical protein